jgi:hypothetical protein
MPRLTKADAALRNVIFAKAPLKTKRQALANMSAPSETFLLDLMSSPSVHPKLKTDAAERLAVVRSLKHSVFGNTRKRSGEPHKDDPDRREEIDAILAEEARQLGMSLEDSGDPNAQPKLGATEIHEPRQTAPSVPQGEAASAPTARPEDERDLVPADAPVVSETVSAQLEPTEQFQEQRSAEREALLVRGRELASRVIAQYNHWTRAPWNREQDAWLRGAQKAFSEWEREMNEKFPEVDTRTLFNDGRLRPYELPISTSVLARALRTPSPIEAHRQSIALARQAERRNERRSTDDLSIWSGLPKGI